MPWQNRSGISKSLRANQRVNSASRIILQGVQYACNIEYMRYQENIYFWVEEVTVIPLFAKIFEASPIEILHVSQMHSS